MNTPPFFLPLCDKDEFHYLINNSKWINYKSHQCRNHWQASSHNGLCVWVCITIELGMSQSPRITKLVVLLQVVWIVDVSSDFHWQYESDDCESFEKPQQFIRNKIEYKNWCHMSNRIRNANYGKFISISLVKATIWQKLFINCWENSRKFLYHFYIFRKFPRRCCPI